MVITLDDNYMFSIKQSIENNSGNIVAVAPYGRILKTLSKTSEKAENVGRSGTGAVTVFNEKLEDYKYKEIRKEGKINLENDKGWFGLSDKYWLTAIIPDKNLTFDAEMTGLNGEESSVFTINYLGKEVILTNGESSQLNNKLFAGAKELKILDSYSEEYDILMFDRSVDFGLFYFITKPLYLLLRTLYNIIGNFGLAIIAMTVIVRTAMLPMMKKTYVSMKKMKKLQPKIDALKKSYGNNKMALNQATMELYKKENVSPLSGCLPMLLQLPIFLSLYKVLSITIDMRHAGFYGWLTNLSAADPSSVFNLFGLLPFDAPFKLGLLPILMGISMYLQQRMNPRPENNDQAKMMKYLPWIFMLMFASLPAGLMLYWITGNFIGIAQQIYINKKVDVK